MYTLIFCILICYASFSIFSIVNLTKIMVGFALIIKFFYKEH